MGSEEVKAIEGTEENLGSPPDQEEEGNKLSNAS